MHKPANIDLYQKGILYLSYSISQADGITHETEQAAIDQICQSEGIPGRIVNEFSRDKNRATEKELFRTGIDSIKQCGKDHQIRTFAWIYKIMEADGDVHIKEARFMLYALKSFDVDIDEVISYTEKLPSISAA